MSVEDHIRKKLKEVIPEMAPNNQYALEHILAAVGKVSPDVMVVSKINDSSCNVHMDMAQLISMWVFGAELRGQDLRCQALICKLLEIRI